MADFATPSAAVMSTSEVAASTEGTKPTGVVRPEKPDETLFKEALEKARKALADAQESTKAAQARVSTARPGNKDSPAAKKQQELRAELSAIRTKQQGFKATRLSTQDRVKALDTQVKTKIQEQKTARAKVPFKSTDEIDREISGLEKNVDTGKMKLVDEKKALADITSLRKQRKAFAGFDDGQKSIDDLKASITELRKELDNPEYKSLSDEYTRIATELDALRAEQDGAFKDLNAHRDALTKARGVQDQKYSDMKALQDNFYQSRRAYMDYEREATRQREAKRKTERDAYAIERKKRDLDNELEEASFPAYADEIKACDNLIRVLDPSATKIAAPTGPGQFAAQAQRLVDEAGIQGTRLIKKVEESYFAGSGGKKGKKGKKARGGEDAPSTPSEPARDLGRFFDPGVSQQFETVKLAPPSSQEEISIVLDKVREKREFWTKDQSRQTQENISNAQKKIDQLLAGGGSGTDTPAETATPAPATKADESSIEELKQLAQEDGLTASNSEAAADVTEKLEDTTIADATPANGHTVNGHAEEE